MTEQKIEYRGHTIGKGYMFPGSFCPDAPYGLYIASIDGPVVDMLLTGHTPEEAIEKAKKEIDKALDGKDGNNG